MLQCTCQLLRKGCNVYCSVQERIDVAIAVRRGKHFVDTQQADISITLHTAESVILVVVTVKIKSTLHLQRNNTVSLVL
jgi:hypothetical protein